MLNKNRARYCCSTHWGPKDQSDLGGLSIPKLIDTPRWTVFSSFFFAKNLFTNNLFKTQYIVVLIIILKIDN
jgi:hypothetical protein